MHRRSSARSARRRTCRCSRRRSSASPATRWCATATSASSSGNDGIASQPRGPGIAGPLFRFRVRIRDARSRNPRGPLLDSRRPHRKSAMPKLRVLALTLGLVAAATMMLSTSGDASAQRRKAKVKPPAFTPQCADFHAYANADWLQANMIVAGSGAQSALGQLAENAHSQQVALLDDYMQNAQGGVAKLLGDFWASGLDEAAIERDGANPVAPLLSRIDSIRRNKDIPAAVAALHQVGIPVLFNFGADVDLADLGRHIGYFSQGGLGLPGAAYYTRDDADTRALMERYRDYVGKILVLTGSKPAQ